jgi:hypothetical protein
LADNRWLLKNICYLCRDFEHFHNIKDNIKMKKHLLSSLLLAVAHEVAALAFVTELITVITHYLEIAPWFTLTAEELQGV